MRRNDTLIRRKFNAYLIPGVLMVMAMQLGNTVDGIFVSHMIDLDGLTAINLSLPVLGVMQVIGFVISMGGEALISVMLGKREIEQLYANGVDAVLDCRVRMLFRAIGFLRVGIVVDPDFVWVRLRYGQRANRRAHGGDSKHKGTNGTICHPQNIVSCRHFASPFFTG